MMPTLVRQNGKAQHEQRDAAGAPSVIIRWRAENASLDSDVGELSFSAPAMILVGRLPNSDICLADERVSRVHAKIYIHEDVVELADAGSSNGTRLAGSEIKREVWQPGQSAKIGGFLLDLIIPEDNNKAPHAGNSAPEYRPGRNPINLQVKITKGDILDCSSQVLLLGLRDELFASSMARLLDKRSGKLLSALRKSGRLNLQTGATTLVPVPQEEIKYGLMLLVGLGHVKAYAGPCELDPAAGLQVDSLIRSLGFYGYEYLLQFGLADAGTVLSLSKRSASPAELAKELVRGCLLAALRARSWPDAPYLPSINLCEIEDRRYDQITAALKQEAKALQDASYRIETLGPSTRDREISLQINLNTAQPKSAKPVSTEFVPAKLRTAFKLDIRVTGVRPADNALELEFTCHRAGCAYEDRHNGVISQETLATQIAEICEPSLPHDTKFKISSSLFNSMIPAPIRQAIEEETQQRPLCLTMDAEIARLPWEGIALADHLPSMKWGVSRILRASRPASVRPMSTNLCLPINLLLVVNPTQDLPGAEKEGEYIAKVAARHPDLLKLTVLRGGEASRQNLYRILPTLQPHIMHFCGHGAFEVGKPAESGLKCAGEATSSGLDMSSINPMPSVLIFNACVSGRMRGVSEAPVSDAPQPSSSAPNAGGYWRPVQSAEPLTSVAEAAIYGGVSSFVGTLWDVGDKAASIFAQSFYEGLLDHKTLGDAIAMARNEIRVIVPTSFDWANYVLYGDESFYLLPAENG